MNYKVVTISNRIPKEDYYTYNQFFKSLRDTEPLVLGQKPGEYTSLSDKPRILYNAIKNGLIKEEIIVFVDCWDVVFVDKMQAIVDKFIEYSTPIIIGAEKNCFPGNFKPEYDRLNHGNSVYRYLNSGVIIGVTEAIMTVLEAMDAPNLPIDYYDPRKDANFHFNDQAMYMDIFLRQPVEMKLDYDCYIAQNMQDVTEDEINFRFDNRILNEKTNTLPSIVHWNGGSKTGWSREPILKHLNLL
jgi:hypothetical protein